MAAPRTPIIERHASETWRMLRQMQAGIAILPLDTFGPEGEIRDMAMTLTERGMDRTPEPVDPTCCAGSVMTGPSLSERIYAGTYVDGQLIDREAFIALVTRELH